jgi:hypothetical protein
MFSYIKDVEGKTIIHNLIFEECFQQYFALAYDRQNAGKINVTQGEYIQNGKLNMPYVIERFQSLIRNEYRKMDNEFLERQGRLLFLCFLKPIVNGTGFYYVEPETRDGGRMDLVVSFAGEEFVIELKIWRGEKFEVEGKVQLAEYLKTRGLNEGYLVTFSFLKNKTVQEEPEWVEHDGKRILIANDTMDFPDCTVEKLAGIHLDYIFADCTWGDIDRQVGHMGIPVIKRQLEKLRAVGAVDDSTVTYPVHIAHNWALPHDQLSMTPAYDGMEIEW